MLAILFYFRALRYESAIALAHKRLICDMSAEPSAVARRASASFSPPPPFDFTAFLLLFFMMITDAADYERLRRFFARLPPDDAAAIFATPMPSDAFAFFAARAFRALAGVAPLRFASRLRRSPR